MQYISDTDFWRRHREWHRSPEAKAMKRRRHAAQRGLCARCRKPALLRRCVLNLTDYEDMKAGRTVKDSDANVLHWNCHPKGTYTRERMRSDQQADTWLRAAHLLCTALTWSIKLPFRALWGLAIAIARATRNRQPR